MSSRMSDDTLGMEQHMSVPLPLEFFEDTAQEELAGALYIPHSAEDAAATPDLLSLFEPASKSSPQQENIRSTMKSTKTKKTTQKSRRCKNNVNVRSVQVIPIDASVRAELRSSDETWTCPVVDTQIVSAIDYVQGGLPGCISKRGSWRSPERFSEHQRKVLVSSASWHPGVFRALATCSTSQVLCFETDAPYCAVEFYFDPLPKPTQAIYEDVWTTEARQSYDFDRISVSVDGVPVSCAYPTAMLQDAYTGMAVLELSCAGDGIPAPSSQQLSLWPDKTFARIHTVRIYLPHTRKVWVRSLYYTGTFMRIPEIEHAKPQLLVLGDSIAQGYLVREAAQTWPQQVAEHLQYTLINQGLGAQVFSPETLVGLSEYIHPQAIIVEFGANYRFEAYSALAAARDIQRYFTLLRQSFPHADIYVVGLLGYLPTWYPTHPQACTDQINPLLYEAAQTIGAHFIDGKRVLGGSEYKLSSWLVDASDHPNDEGHMHMAEAIYAAIRRASRQRRRVPEFQPLPLEINMENL